MCFCAIALLLSSALVLQDLPPAKHDVGGVSFNFKAISDARGEKISDAENREGLSIHVQTTDALDGRFVLSSGQVTALCLNIVSDTPEKWKTDSIALDFKLPQGVRLVDYTREIYVSKKVQWWKSVYVLLKAVGPVGIAGGGRITIDYDDGIKKSSFSSKPIEFEIIPPIKTIVPKRYRNGAFVMGSFRLPSAESRDLYAQSIADYGCRWVIPSMDDSYPALDAWRKYGMWVTPYSSFLMNGYKITIGKIPKNDQFVIGSSNSQMRKIPPPDKRICPLAVAERSEYYRTTVEPLLKRKLAGTDGIWANWEPYMFRGVGCFCERCRDSFVEFSGKSAAEVASGWPTNTFRGGKWEHEGVRFRSVCHGRLVKTIYESVRQIIGDAPVGFMPAVHFEQLQENWRTRRPMPEAHEIDYASSLKWLHVWGPYVPWFMEKPYFRERGKYVSHCLFASTVRKGVDRDYPLPNRPKILAGPQGVISNWATQPENFKMAFDAYFFNRYDGCAPWVFPVGADGRYWREYAAATGLAAKYEAVVFEGRSIDERITVETVPEYAAVIHAPSHRLPEVKDVSHLFAYAYEKDSLRIVALFNCWQDGEAFLTLKMSKVEPGEYEIVSDDGVRWMKDDLKSTWTAEDLVSAVFLSVGAARTRVFEIRRVGLNAPTVATSYTTTDRVLKDYVLRRPVLAKAAAEDAEESKKHSGAPSRED